MSKSNMPSKCSSNDDKTPSKLKLNLPKLNVTVATSALKKPKAKAMEVTSMTQPWKCIHIAPKNADNDSLSGFLLVCDGRLERNMCPPLSHRKDPEVVEYIKSIDCVGHVFSPILPGGGEVLNQKNYTMKGLLFIVGVPTSMQEVRTHIEACVQGNIIAHACFSMCMDPIEETHLWLDSECTKIPYFSMTLIGVISNGFSIMCAFMMSAAPKSPGSNTGRLTPRISHPH
jgi:hypothetical protein